MFNEYKNDFEQLIAEWWMGERGTRERNKKNFLQLNERLSQKTSVTYSKQSYEGKF